jgi:hypothetical protein
VSEYAEAEVMEAVRSATGCPEGRWDLRIQSLWSGYGAILRFLTGLEEPGSWIVKHVSPPSAPRHPRGSSTDVGHERKLRSYEVEMHWYGHFASRCDEHCRVPVARHLAQRDGEWLFVLEDLDAAGFPERRSALTDAELSACLRFLAHFHATFLGDEGEGLWDVGTYWHLATRPDELLVVRDKELREAAPRIDERLSAARFSTLVHGDAKVENFCFPVSSGASSAQEISVAAVDFQYVGRGVGVKDVAYFLSSCLDERECEARADEWLEVYFRHLVTALAACRPDVDASLVEAEWRALYPFAWADFLRFLIGWAPDHYKIHGYSRRMVQETLAMLARASATES